LIAPVPSRLIDLAKKYFFSSRRVAVVVQDDGAPYFGDLIVLCCSYLPFRRKKIPTLLRFNISWISLGPISGAFPAKPWVPRRHCAATVSLLALLRVGAFVPGASCGGPPRDPSRSLLNPHGSHARLYFMSREKRASRGFLQTIPSRLSCQS
jgi:hypothetical protein